MSYYRSSDKMRIFSYRFWVNSVFNWTGSTFGLIGGVAGQVCHHQSISRYLLSFYTTSSPRSGVAVCLLVMKPKYHSIYSQLKRASTFHNSTFTLSFSTCSLNPSRGRPLPATWGYAKRGLPLHDTTTVSLCRARGNTVVTQSDVETGAASC